MIDESVKDRVPNLITAHVKTRLRANTSSRCGIGTISRRRRRIIIGIGLLVVHLQQIGAEDDIDIGELITMVLG